MKLPTHEDPQVYEISKQLISKDLQTTYEKIIHLITAFPNEPWGHNLLGCWFEIQGDVIHAMKHYRAAYALDPSYDPSRMNIIEFQLHSRHTNSIYFNKESQ
ncbi:MAG: hypothetical protein KGZ51_03445 [Erysipelothrix sp.]|jgi:hypothetical protein|nr:hypothetical protein [Erysipelothrix sp.]